MDIIVSTRFYGTQYSEKGLTGIKTHSVHLKFGQAKFLWRMVSKLVTTLCGETVMMPSSNIVKMTVDFS